jgi:hypothetical protein
MAVTGTSRADSRGGGLTRGVGIRLFANFSDEPIKAAKALRRRPLIRRRIQ